MQHTLQNVPPDQRQKVDEQALKQGYESLGVSIRGLARFVFFFLLTAAVLHTDLWVLLNYYVRRSNPDDARQSVVSAIVLQPNPPLQPIPMHNNLPFQDLAELRDAEERKFLSAGWKIDPETSVPTIPRAVIASLQNRGKRRQAPATSAEPLFPPPIATVQTRDPELPRRVSAMPPTHPEQAARDRIVYGEPPRPGPSTKP